jgi:chromosome partitioning protein
MLCSIIADKTKRKMKIGITNLKGGVGKTTLSTNLAVCFAHMGYSVCIVDSDTNQNSLAWYGAREEGPAIMVVGATDAKALNKIVDQLNQKHDIIIMDGTPSLSEMNTRIIMASDLLLIPIRPGAHDMRAMQEFLTRINQVNEIKPVNPFFIINEFDDRINLHRTVYDALKENSEIPILKSTLKSRTAYGEASVAGSGVFELSDDKAKLEVVQLTKEIISLAKKHSLIN